MATALRRLAGVAALAVGAHQVDSRFGSGQIDRSVTAVVRNARAVWTAAATVYDYKVDLSRHPEQLSEIHARVAQRWYDLCRFNGGLYVKLGQSISMMSHVLPPEFATLFTNLQDQAPSVTPEEIAQVIEQDFGQPIEEVFGTFSPTPIASASIAQVHSATLPDGTKVAVKVQKPEIATQMPLDLLCYRLLVWCFDKAFDLPMYWTVDNVCESLTKEADFRIEEEHTLRAKHDLEHMKDVYVPQVFTDLTRRRVLVLEWIDGVKISDEKAVTDLGYSQGAAINTFMRALSHQIFVAGFVHGDPHPGNVLVRKHPNNSKEYQVVILDHGLVLHESEQFRSDYCNLWRAMVLGDVDTLKDICMSWGIRDHELFASTQLFKPFTAKKKAIHIRKTTREDMLQMQVRAKERVRELLENTHQIPRELIVLGRSMNIMRACNRACKQGSSSRIAIMAEYAAKGAALTAKKKYGAFSSFREMWSFRIRLWSLSLAYYLSRLLASINGFIWGKPSDTVDEMLEKRANQELVQRLGLRVRDTDIG